jgi:hypothetical protein
MARKLKTYQTSLGFFDLAISAPSMKAALEAWGADRNLFHQGAAKESQDPDVIAATMKRPGVVLRRPVGSDVSFSEHAEPPTDLGDAGRSKPLARRKAARRRPLPLAPATRRRSAKPLSRMNASRKTASANGRGKRRSGRRVVNAGSRPSTRRKRRWARLRASMQSEPAPSKPRWRLLRRDRKPKMPAGTRRKSGWKPHCGAPGARSRS